MISAQQALQQLRDGNRRFVSDDSSHNKLTHRTSRDELVAGQAPFAIVLGCSDSRVPTEIIFDQGLGDLFVIRVAGNIVEPSQLGSVEFAAERFGTRLVVVLGHSQCSAVSTAIEELERPADNRSPNLAAIVDFIRPSVQGLLQSENRQSPDGLLKQAIRENIRTSVSHLRSRSNILRRLIRKNGLMVVGAEYSIATGIVCFFEAT
ncbi:MAG: carbonic anhydrase [Planctomycetota bacterium]